MGMRRYPGCHKTLHGEAHFIQRAVKGAIAEGQFALLLLHEFNEAGAVGGRVAAVEKRASGYGLQVALAEAQAGEAKDFGLVHGNSTHDLVQVFSAGDFHQELFHFPQLAEAGKPCHIGGERLESIQIGGKPSQPMGRVLVLVKGCRGKCAVGADQQAQSQFCLGKNTCGRRACFVY